MSTTSKLLTLTVGLLSLVVGAWFLFRGSATSEPRAGLTQQIAMRLAEHERLQAALVQDGAGEAPLAVYLARIRRDGVPQHAAMHRQLAALAQLNAELLVLAEAYEPLARQSDYGSRLRELRTYVITWNDRWNGIFETFMAGGNLAGGEPSLPRRFTEAFDEPNA